MFSKIFRPFSFQRQLRQLIDQPITDHGRCFKQLIYLDLVHRELQSRKSLLLNRKNFYFMEEYFKSENKETIQKCIEEVDKQTLRNSIMGCAEILLNQELNILKFIEIVTLLHEHKELSRFKPKIAIHIERFRNIQPTDMSKVSAVSVSKFSMATKVLLKDESSVELQMNAQRLIFNLIIHKIQKLSLNNIFTILLNSQEIQTRLIGGQQDYKDLATQVMNAITKRFIELVEQPKEEQKMPQQSDILDHPQFYITFLRYLSINQALTTDICNIIEDLFTKNLKFRDINDNKFTMHAILFTQLSKVNSGWKVYERICNVDLNVLNKHKVEYLPQILHSLLQFHVGGLLRQLPNGFKRNQFDEAIKQPIQCEKLIRKMLDIIKSHEIQYNEVNTYQLVNSIELLKCLNFSHDALPFLESAHSEAKQFKVSQHFNEINVDVENCLKNLNLQKQSEYQTKSMFLDYYVPELNLVIECDGVYHFIPKSLNPITSCLARNFMILSFGHRLIQINYLKQVEARAGKEPDSYIRECISVIQDNDEIVFVT